MDNYINKKKSEGKIPRLYISIQSSDSLLYDKGFGYSDSSQKNPITNKTLFELSSNSKALTALCIIALVNS